MTTNSLLTGKISLLAAALCLAFSPSAIAAPEAPPVPRLNAAPGSSAWTIEYQYKAPNPYLTPPDPSQADAYARLRNQFARPVSIQVAKEGYHRKEVFLLDNQKKTIRWIIGDLLVMENPQLNTFSVWDAKVPGTFPFLHDFDSLSWVDQADYKGHQTFQQTDCCVYTSKSTPIGEQTAYISAASGLPVGVQQGGVTLLYTFTSSGGSIEIPAEVMARIRQYKEATSGSNP